MITYQTTMRRGILSQWGPHQAVNFEFTGLEERNFRWRKEGKGWHGTALYIEFESCCVAL